MEVLLEKDVREAVPGLAPLSPKVLEGVRALLEVPMKASHSLTLRGEEGRLTLSRRSPKALLELSFPFAGKGSWEVSVDPKTLGELLERIPSPPAIGPEGKDLALQAGRFRARLFGEKTLEGSWDLPLLHTAQVLRDPFKRALAAVARHAEDGSEGPRGKVLLAPHGDGLVLLASDGYTLGVHRFPEAGSLPPFALGPAQVRFLSAALRVAPPVLRLGAREKVLTLSGTLGPLGFTAAVVGEKVEAEERLQVLRHLEAERPYRAVVRAKELSRVLKGMEGLLVLRAAPPALEVASEEGGTRVQVGALFPRAWAGGVKVEAGLLARALAGFPGRVVLALDREGKTLALSSAEEAEGQGFTALVAVKEVEGW